MPYKIHRSAAPDIPLPETSIFNFVFGENFNKFPETDTAFIDAVDGKTVTRGELKRAALQCAWSLKNTLGRKRGDTILVFSPNSIAFTTLIFGGVAAGLRLTFANATYDHAALGRQYTDSEATNLFVHPTLLHVALAMLESIGINRTKAKEIIVVMGINGDELAMRQAASFDKFILMTDFLAGPQLDTVEAFEGQDSREVVYMCYTSGTTTLSKGVQTMHYNVTSVLSLLGVSLGSIIQEDEMVLGILPYYHIYGLIVLNHLTLLQGVPNVVCPRFEPHLFCASIQAYKITAIFISPPSLVVLNNHPMADKYDLSSLRLMVSGAAPLAKELVLGVVNRLKALGTNVTLFNGYGMTETSTVSHVLPPDMSISKIGSVGLLMPNIELRLVDEDGSDADPRTGGEIWIRSPGLVKGYLKNPTAVKSAFTDDRWFKSGDFARVDEEGFFYIVDRKKELIHYRGFQVSPAELEDVILGHPEVADTGVIAVEDKTLNTEIPRAYVVPRKGLGSLPTDEEKAAFASRVQAWVDAKVRDEQRLRGGVAVTDTIPKNFTGKILRRELRLRAEKELSSSFETPTRLIDPATARTVPAAAPKVAAPAKVASAKVEPVAQPKPLPPPETRAKAHGKKENIFSLLFTRKSRRANTAPVSS